MMLANVVGNVWATRKDDKLRGLKLLVVQPITAAGAPVGTELVAADRIGAGIGETVLITQGSGARKATDDGDVAIDAVVVGIIDTVEVMKGRGLA
ncbi:MAG TPA: EutN/CcmL family microcompartment protein [Symbiobacteriaceae bacterium]